MIPVLLLLALIMVCIWLVYSDTLARYPAITKVAYWIFLFVTPFVLFVIVEMCWNSQATSISLKYIMVNIAIYALLEIICINLVRKWHVGLIFLYVFALVTGGGNHFIVQFRRQPIQVVDLLSSSTAFAVAGQYQYDITVAIALASLIVFFAICLILAFNKAGIMISNRTRGSFVICKGIAVMAVTMLLVWVANVDFDKAYSMEVDFLSPKTTYQKTGFAPAFISFSQKTKIEEPEGYSSQVASNIIGKYADAYDDKYDSGEPSQKKPTIIVIMNESFSDLSVLGPLECVDDHLAFYRSLKDDPNMVEYGWTYVSTRGGGTANSEYEYLTGNSMLFMSGLVQYATSEFDTVPSIVSVLKAQGYNAIAMHPEAASNYRREDVYSQLGFDEMLFIDDFSDVDRTVWGRVSDAGNFDKLIEVYENQDGPAFIFNVTMENHGGYEDISELEEEGVEIVDVDEQYSQYSDVVMYQSLMKNTDIALEPLMEYFRGVDEPVVICFFGDHQPSLDAQFEESIVEAGTEPSDTDISISEKYYATPYFIWSNIKTSEGETERDEEPIAIVDEDGYSSTSLNYLSALTLRYADVGLSDFDKFRLMLRESMPVVNIAGYMDATGAWHATAVQGENQTEEGESDTSVSAQKQGEAIASMIEEYEVVSYNIMFDEDRDINRYLPE